MCLHIFESSDELTICQRQIVGRRPIRVRHLPSIVPYYSQPNFYRGLAALMSFVQVHVFAFIVVEQLIFVKEESDFALAAVLGI